MSIMTVVTELTPKSLMRKSKRELVDLVLMYADTPDPSDIHDVGNLIDKPEDEAELKQVTCERDDLRVQLGVTIAQRNEAERAVNENADMVDKFVCLFLAANAAKRAYRRERNLAIATGTTLLQQRDVARAALREWQEGRDVNALADYADTEIRKRAEQAEAALGAAINQRNEAERLVNENADMIDQFVCLFQMANSRKRVRQAEIRTMIRKLTQAEADARALAEYASISAIVADVEYGHRKMERVTALITKYLEATK